jgi:hypothetical protein
MRLTSEISYGVAELQAAYYLNPNDATQTVSFPGFVCAMPVQMLRRGAYPTGFMPVYLASLAFGAKV